MHNHTVIDFIIYLVILWILSLINALLTKLDVSICFCVLGVTEILRILFYKRGE